MVFAWKKLQVSGGLELRIMASVVGALAKSLGKRQKQAKTRQQRDLSVMSGRMLGMLGCSISSCASGMIPSGWWHRGA